MTQQPSQPLEFTGERFTPECVREIWYEHFHRYVLAAEWVRGKTVLDAACGEGYGSSHLAEQARSVIGVDISASAVEHASRRYHMANLSFQQADCCQLPFADGQFQCIVSFETLEHLQEQERLLSEFRRVLAPDGFLLMSCPDKAVYSEALGNNNPYHVRELYRSEFDGLLAREFPAVRVLGQKLAFHSMIWPLDKPLATATSPAASEALFDPAENARAESTTVMHLQHDGKASRVAGPVAEAVYLIALCSSETRYLPELDQQLWLFDDVDESVYRHYQHEIRKNMEAGAVLQARDEEISALKSQLKQLETGSSSSWWRRLLGRR